MAANTLNLTVDQGATHVFDFNLMDGVVPLNITGYDARMQVRKTYASGVKLIDATITNTKLAITDASGGVLTLTILPTDTSVISIPGNEDQLDCVYDLEVISPAGRVYKPARGDFTIRREVTR